jgi:tetratricopeptide (TPR) repeat protein
MKRTILIFILIFSFSCPILQAQTSRTQINQAQELFNQGVKYGVGGKYDSALDQFNQAIELYPLFAEAYLYRGLARIEKGFFQDATRDFSITIELDPGLADQAYYFRGVARAGLKDYPAAIHDLSVAINLSPDHISFFQRGKAYLSMQQYGRALQDFEVALRLKAGFPEGILYRGIALYHTGLYAEALDDLNRAVGLFPGSAEAYYYRGMTYRALEKEEAAEDNLARAMRLDPEIGFQEKQTLAHEAIKPPDSLQYVEETPAGIAELSMQAEVPEVASPTPEPLPSATGIAGPGFYDHTLAPAQKPLGFGVQVASFSGLDNLVRLSTAYKERYGQPVIVHVSTANGRMTYRIIIGRFDQRAHAEALRDTFRRSDFPDSFLVVFDQLR